jgi:hypothetical protein
MLLRPDMSPQKIKYTIRHVRSTKRAEGANLEQANPDETLRQKDPAPKQLWKIPHRDTDGVKF